MLDLARRRYEAKFDPITSEGWFRNIVLKQPVIFAPQRMHNAWCISMLSLVPWFPSDVECSVIFILAEEGAMWEAMKLLRASINWARERGCKLWRLSSDTKHDIAPLALRLGAKELSPRYELRF